MKRSMEGWDSRMDGRVYEDREGGEGSFVSEGRKGKGVRKEGEDRANMDGLEEKAKEMSRFGRGG
jgi:hypothetical protein